MSQGCLWEGIKALGESPILRDPLPFTHLCATSPFSEGRAAKAQRWKGTSRVLSYIPGQLVLDLVSEPRSPDSRSRALYTPPNPCLHLWSVTPTRLFSSSCAVDTGGRGEPRGFRSSIPVWTAPWFFNPLSSTVLGLRLAHPERRALTLSLFPQGPLDVTLTQPVRSGPISDR